MWEPPLFLSSVGMLGMAVVVRWGVMVGWGWDQEVGWQNEAVGNLKIADLQHGILADTCPGQGESASLVEQAKARVCAGGL